MSELQQEFEEITNSLRSPTFRDDTSFQSPSLEQHQQPNDPKDQQWKPIKGNYKLSHDLLRKNGRKNSNLEDQRFVTPETEEIEHPPIPQQKLYTLPKAQTTRKESINIALTNRED